MQHAKSLLILTWLLAAPALEAQLRPQGPAFAVSECAECSSEFGPTVAAGETFYLTWCASLPSASFSAFGRALGDDGVGISTRRFGDDSLQTGCRDVGVDGAGDFVVLWQHPTEIWLQRFSPVGSPQTDPFRVNNPPTGIDDDIARMGVDSAGFAAVGFYTSLQVATPPQVYAQIVDPSNQVVAPAVQLSGIFPVAFADGLTIAPLGDSGVFYVLWQTSLDANQRGDQPGPKGLSMRRIDRQGQTVGPEIVLVEPSGSQFSLSPDLAGDPDGEFLVLAWQTNLPPAKANGDVVAMFLDSQGETTIPPFRLNKKKRGAQVAPRVAFTTTHEVLTLWETNKGGTARIWGRQLRRDGSFRKRDRKLTDLMPAQRVSPFGILGADLAVVDTTGEGLVVWSTEDGLVGRLLGGVR